MEIDAMTKELMQKNEMIKSQAEKLKNINEKNPFQNSFIDQKLENKKTAQFLAKGMKNTNETNEIINPEAFIDKESRRKTSVSSVSGSNRSIQTHNSLKSSNFEFEKVEKGEKAEKETENNKREQNESSFLYERDFFNRRPLNEKKN